MKTGDLGINLGHNGDFPNIWELIIDCGDIVVGAKIAKMVNISTTARVHAEYASS